MERNYVCNDFSSIHPCIPGKITETNGDTDWLKDGAPHCHVRRDFFDTERGVKKVTDYVDVGDNTTQASQSY